MRRATVALLIAALVAGACTTEVEVVEPVSRGTLVPASELRDAIAFTPPQPEPEPEPEPEPDPEPEPEPDPVTAPTTVSIPRLGVSAPLDAVGLEPDGAMEIPHDIRRVGWYELGVKPGEPTGTAVLSGHVDSRSQGRGALWDLKALDPGDTVELAHADGLTTTWRVTQRTSYPKSELPIPDIFTRFGPTRLVLITCGGSFDSSRGSYTHNIVVYAEPVSDRA